VVPFIEAVVEAVMEAVVEAARFCALTEDEATLDDVVVDW